MSATTSTKKILLVVSEKYELDVYSRLLEEVTRNIFTAETPMEAIGAMATTRPGSPILPDLIVTDLITPDMRGDEFVEMARRRFVPHTGMHIILAPHNLHGAPGMELDEVALARQKLFQFKRPVPPLDLVERAKEILLTL